MPEQTSDVLLTTVDGVPAVKIPMPDGVSTKCYFFKIEVRPGWWCCSLRQSGGVTYAVVCRGEDWSCTCPDWKYRADRHERPCKHINAGKGLKKLLETMAGGVES
jgi:hypothetical protein